MTRRLDWADYRFAEFAGADPRRAIAILPRAALCRYRAFSAFQGSCSTLTPMLTWFPDGERNAKTLGSGEIS